MAALEDKIPIPTQPCNILYISKSVFFFTKIKTLSKLWRGLLSYVSWQHIAWLILPFPLLSLLKFHSEVFLCRPARACLIKRCFHVGGNITSIRSHLLYSSTKRVLFWPTSWFWATLQCLYGLSYSFLKDLAFIWLDDLAVFEKINYESIHHGRTTLWAKKNYLSVTDPVSLGIINNFFPFLGGSPTASGRLRDRIERLRR